MKCEGKIGCHYCVNFLQVLEAKLEKVYEVLKGSASPENVKEIQDAILIIAAHKKGE